MFETKNGKKSSGAAEVPSKQAGNREVDAGDSQEETRDDTLSSVFTTTNAKDAVSPHRESERKGEGRGGRGARWGACVRVCSTRHRRKGRGRGEGGRARARQSRGRMEKEKREGATCVDVRLISRPTTTMTARLPHTHTHMKSKQSLWSCEWRASAQIHPRTHTRGYRRRHVRGGAQYQHRELSYVLGSVV